MTEDKRPGTLAELYQLLADFDTAMLVTLTSEHQLHARPMQIQDPKLVPDCDLWFVTAADTAKVTEIEGEQQVNVSCLRKDKAYLSIAARARVSDDTNEIRRLYKPEWRIWMGDDAATSALIIKLVIERAEYWQPEGGRARILYEALKAAVTGEAASGNLPPPKSI
jgi:general stress protein 26